MNMPDRHIKTKIIIGYILLFLLTLITTTFIYKKVSKFTDEPQLVSEANQKLFIVGNTITNLYEAEALSNSFLQTGSNSDFRKYLRLIQEVGENIDSLKTMQHDSLQLSRIDTIRLLLDEKIENLRELIRVKKSYSIENFYTQAVAMIESTKDSTQKPNIRKQTVTTRDTVYVIGEKKRKGFLGIFGPKTADTSFQVTVSEQVVLDTTTAININNTDSAVNILKTAWENFQTETQHINRKIYRKEYNIVIQSVQITEQLKKVLSDYETEEINHSISRIKERETVINSTAELIAKIAIIAVILIAFFCTLILKDISKSQHYRKELETANAYTKQLLKSREKLILTITHDIKSPIGSIMGYIELLQNTPTDKRQQYYLQNMQGSSRHILNLVSNLLDYSKLENNKMPVEEIVFNPYRLFQEIAESFLPLAESKSLTLKYRIDSTLNTNRQGDALKIRQILNNILSNALKYTSQGEVCFTATLSQAQQTTIQIKDSGPGMNETEQKTIFEEFTRLSSATTEGTGLGLTITLKLVELIGGHITLESEPGKGSCFTILLPLKQADSGNTFKYSDRTTPTRVPRTLLIDDDPLQLNMTAGLLARMGIKATITTHPEEVIEKLKNNTFDLIFSDIQMPELNGFELIKQIRHFPANRTLPVIALSADSEKTAKDYLQAGFTAYLNKPFSTSQLALLIEQLTGYSYQTEPSSAKKTSVVDKKEYTLKNILLFTDNDKQATSEIIRSFITESENHLRLLKQYDKEKQQENISRLAHKMLPIFRQLEANQITPLLEKLEYSTETLSDDERTTYIHQCICLIKELIEKLKTAF